MSAKSAAAPTMSERLPKSSRTTRPQTTTDRLPATADSARSVHQLPPKTPAHARSRRKYSGGNATRVSTRWSDAMSWTLAVSSSQTLGPSRS